MRHWLLGLSLVLLAGCAPRAQHSYELLVSPEGRLTHQTLEAPFYRSLLELGVTVESYEAYRYDGRDGSVPRQLEAGLAEDEGETFCGFRGNRFRSQDGGKVLLLFANAQLEVHGLIYDLSRAPRLSYTFFRGSSFRPLVTGRC